MEAPSAPAAVAQPAAPETVSATFDAATKGDFAAFQDAESSARAGKPVADVPATPKAPAADGAAPVQPVSKRQDEINNRIREAVDRATAETRAELDRLRAELKPAAPRTDQPKAEPPAAAWKRFAQMPDAPKLAEFDSVEEHTAAMSFFINQKVHEERTSEAQSRAEHDELTAAQNQRVDTFVSRLNDAKTADPEFVTKLTPDVRALKPFGGLQPGEQGGPRNVIAEQIYDSPIAPQVLLHLSQHPEVMAALEAMPAHIASLPTQLRTKAHIQHIVREYGKLEGSLATAATADRPAAPSTITAAPPPPPSVSSRAGTGADPATAAVAKGDFAAFKRHEDAKRREAMGR